MFQLTNIGTNISAPMSVKVTVIPFSLFTAYQFLSSDRRLDAPESKIRPYPSCVYQWFCAYMMEMIARSFFFVYCVSNFEFWFLFANRLDKYVFLSYNTTPTEEWWRYSPALGSLIFLTTCLSSLFRWFTTYIDLVWFFSTLYVFLLFLRSKFRANLPSENKTTYQSFGARIWPHLWP